MIITRLTKLPPKVKGFVSEDSEGNYNIYINCNHSFEMQKEAFDKEMEHIDGGDLFRSESADRIEMYQHYLSKRNLR